MKKVRSSLDLNDQLPQFYLELTVETYSNAYREDLLRLVHLGEPSCSTCQRDNRRARHCEFSQ